jgi:hypothetical protein
MDMARRWLPGLIVVLLITNQSEAANLRVSLIQELSDDNVWRFEIINDSVDTLDVQQLTVTFLADGRRLWTIPVALTPRWLQRGDSGWVMLDARQVPKVRPLQMIWELTWNPHGVPVLHRFWRTERVASLELAPPPAPRGVMRPAEPETPAPLREAPTWRF